MNTLLSLYAWIFVAGGTVVLFLFGLVFLWPISFFFDRASGLLPHNLSRLWASLISRHLRLGEIQIVGLEQIDKKRPYVIVSNHQSLLDILVMLSRLPLHFKFISKWELFWIPFFGWHMALAGYIPLRRGDRLSGKKCLEKARYWLARGVSVLFFPEGTRSLDGKIHAFKVGAFKLALEEKVDLLPIAIQGTREAIPKRSWRLRKGAVLRVCVFNPLSTQNSSLEDLDQLRDRVRGMIVGEFEKLKTLAENS